MLVGFHHKGHEDIVITVIDLETTDLDAYNVTHSKIAGLTLCPLPY